MVKASLTSVVSSSNSSSSSRLAHPSQSVRTPLQNLSLWVDLLVSPTATPAPTLEQCSADHRVTLLRLPTLVLWVSRLLQGSALTRRRLEVCRRAWVRRGRMLSSNPCRLPAGGQVAAARVLRAKAALLQLTHSVPKLRKDRCREASLLSKPTNPTLLTTCIYLVSPFLLIEQPDSGALCSTLSFGLSFHITHSRLLVSCHNLSTFKSIANT